MRVCSSETENKTKAMVGRRACTFTWCPASVPTSVGKLRQAQGRGGWIGSNGGGNGPTSPTRHPKSYPTIEIIIRSGERAINPIVYGRSRRRKRAETRYTPVEESSISRIFYRLSGFPGVFS